MGAGKTEKVHEVYRITKERYSEDLSGAGARRFGGRWNSRGVPVVYASQHRSLCLLEFLVHLAPDLLPSDMCLVTIRIPQGVPACDLPTTGLPSGSTELPACDLPTTGLPSGSTELPACDLPTTGLPSRSTELPFGWRGYPYDDLTQQIGDLLLKSGRYGMIRVPSAIVVEERNCLIHPPVAAEHGVFVSEVKPLYLDGRLLWKIAAE